MKPFTVSLSLISFNRLPILTTLLLAVAIITSAATSPPAAVTRPQATPKIGQQAPAFTLRDHNGRRVSLDAAGAKVVLVFYRGYW